MPRYFSSIRSSMRQPFVAAVAPVFAGLLVQHFGQGLGEPVGQRLAHDRVVVVVVAVELLDQRLEAESRRHGEGAQVVGDAGRARGEVVGQRAERGLAVALPLLPEQRGTASARCPATRRCRPRCRRRRRWPGRSRRRRCAVSRFSATICAAAPGRRRRARGLRGPTLGVVEDLGYFPFSSQVMKNGDQSMNGTISSSGIARRASACPGTRGRRSAVLVPVDPEAALDGLGVGDELALARWANVWRSRSWTARFWRSSSTRPRAGAGDRRRRRSWRRP